MKKNYNLIFTKDLLHELYINKLKNPYEIAEMYQCNHKTVRKFLKQHNIQLRTASEFNSLSHKTYTEPTSEELYLPLSLVLHSIYECEGATGKTINFLRFQNQDIQLILSFAHGIQKIYHYTTPLVFEILYNFECQNSTKIAKFYEQSLANSANSSIKFIHITKNKNPIIRVACGGQRLYELFCNNKQIILNSSL